MTTRCQTARPLVIGVSGPAGSGKTTLGRQLASTLGLPLLDLDTLTSTLLDRLHGGVLGEHWLSGPHATDIRDARYAALRATAADVAATAGGAVLVAPFTAELAGGGEWTALTGALAPAELHMVHLSGEPELFAHRRGLRGATRDAHRNDVRPPPPSIPHLPIDAQLTPAQQSFRVLRAMGSRTSLDPDAPVLGRDHDAVLFDVDGVLVDSTASVLRSWARFARERDLPAVHVERNHGMPAGALMRQLVAAEEVAGGMVRIEELEVADAPTVEPVPGARDLLAALPTDRVAFVTSGTRAVARARLSTVDIPLPPVFVTADDVTAGKPDPEPYLLAAERLGVRPERCLVVEDAPAGVAAARAAGCAVIGVLGTTEADALTGTDMHTGADVLVDGLDRLSAATPPHAPGAVRISAAGAFPGAVRP